MHSVEVDIGICTVVVCIYCTVRSAASPRNVAATYDRVSTADARKWYPRCARRCFGRAVGNVIRNDRILLTNVREFELVALQAAVELLLVGNLPGFTLAVMLLTIMHETTIRFRLGSLFVSRLIPNSPAACQENDSNGFTQVYGVSISA